MVTIIIMEAFINKMRRLKRGYANSSSSREAWKALSTANMAEYLRYMYKTVRKYYGEAIVVTQEVEDIISSPVVKGRRSSTTRTARSCSTSASS